MLFESQEFQRKFPKHEIRSEHVFKYCEFKNIDSSGGDIDGIYVGCRFTQCDWYWGLFNCAIFCNVKFIGCNFRGTGFSGSKFIECDFIDCTFKKDNLNADCTFDDVAWYKCQQEHCEGLEYQFKSRR